MKRVLLLLIVSVFAFAGLTATINQEASAKTFKSVTKCVNYKTNVNGKACFKLSYYKKYVTRNGIKVPKYKPYSVYVWWSSYYKEPGGSMHKITNPKFYYPLKSGNKFVYWKNWEYNYTYNVMSNTKWSARKYVKITGGLDGPQWMNDDLNTRIYMR